MKNISAAKTAAILGGLILAASASLANATAITSLANGTPVVMPANNLFTAGPVVEPGYTYTSSNSNSVFGYTFGYGLNNNGAWNSGLGSPYLGLNTSEGWSLITFDAPVSSVLAFVNYADQTGTPIISVFDAGNNLIESTVLNFSTTGDNQGFNYGFTESSNIIKSIEFSNAYIVATNIQTEVPEPSTLALFGLAIAALVARLRRNRV